MELQGLILLILLLATALLAVEAKRTVKAVIYFLIMSILLAITFFVMGAFYAAAFQILIYAGAVVIMTLITLHAIRRW